MILFDLVCDKDHRFEGWFRDGATYDAQEAKRKVSCPNCGSVKVRKAPMAPALVSTRGDAKPAKSSENKGEGEMPSPEKVRELLTEIRKHVESNFDYVGDRFPEEARRIHYGETDAHAIYGEAASAEVKELSEEGIDVVSVPWAERQDS